MHLVAFYFFQRRLAWWPNISLIYGKAAELRNMFTDTLNKVTQGMTSHTTTKPTGVGGLPSVSSPREQTD